MMRKMFSGLFVTIVWLTIVSWCQYSPDNGSTQVARKSAMGPTGKTSETLTSSESLDLVLFAPSTVIKMSDSFNVTLLIHNRSQEQVFIYGDLEWGQLASFSLWAEDAATGEDLPLNFIPGAVTPPATSRDDFIRLLPNHVYGVCVTLKPADLGIQKPGKYKVIAEYHSPVPEKRNFGLLVWSRERGAIVANSVELLVK